VHVVPWWDPFLWMCLFSYWGCCVDARGFELLGKEGDCQFAPINTALPTWPKKEAVSSPYDWSDTTIIYSLSNTSSFSLQITSLTKDLRKDLQWFIFLNHFLAGAFSHTGSQVRQSTCVHFQLQMMLHTWTTVRA
jgi:hypothetical protein